MASDIGNAAINFASRAFQRQFINLPSGNSDEAHVPEAEPSQGSKACHSDMAMRCRD
jgi:hypothetical protein